MSKQNQNEAVTAESINVVQPSIMVPLEKIMVVAEDNQRRFNPPAAYIQGLAASIQTIGLLHPLTVKAMETPENGFEYRLSAGFQRERALRLLLEGGDERYAEVPVVVTNAEHKAVNRAENAQHAPPSYIDYAYQIAAHVTGGGTKTEIAKELGKTGPWVTEVSKFVNLRPEIQRQIHSGDIPYKLAKELTKLETEEEQDALIKRYFAGDTATDAVAGSKGKRKKGKGGRKKSEDQESGATKMSAKKAVLEFSGAVDELKELEKPTKVQAAKLTLYQSLVKFLSGGLGAKALDNRITELLG